MGNNPVSHQTLPPQSSQASASMIAIDGPAASGKSTLALLIARRLNYLYFDTGVMYRAVTWAVLAHKLNVLDETAVTNLAEQAQIDVQPPTQEDGRQNDILVDNQDVTWAIRTQEVEANVSVVAAYPGVRRALTAQQRRVGLKGRVVMVGRDIGTVVLPDADIKIFLDASAEERTRRRYLELIQRGQEADYAELLAAVKKRDQIDSSRQVAPLRPAEDACILVSDGKTIEEVFEEAMAIIQKSKA